jgi:omega-hydroxy-beta-dihydromenaquinone-9 sulfotransferase
MKPRRPMDNVKLGFDEPQEEEYALIKLTTDSPLEKLIFPKGKKYFLIDFDNYFPDDSEKWKGAFSKYCNRLSFVDGKRVLLKNPFHSMRIPLLLEMFPNAKFIHVHRHPYEVIPSTIHMWTVVGNENKLKGKRISTSVDEVAKVYKRMLETINEQFKNLPENVKATVEFMDLEKDPLSTIKSIYNKLELAFNPEFEVEIKKWLDEVKSYQKNRYSLDDTEKETIRKILQKHFIYYNYPQ